MTCYYTCKHCGAEIECSVIINEEDDLPENCPECNAPVPDKAHEDVNTQAMERASERPDFD
jgi:predicted nucleic acid-binding Zn ribbon protein